MTESDKPSSPDDHQQKELQDDLIENPPLDRIVSLSEERYRAMIAKDADKPSPDDYRQKEIQDDIIEDTILDRVATINAERHRAKVAGDEAAVETLTEVLKDLHRQYLAFRMQR